MEALALVELEQREQLTEDPRSVAAVELVDDQHEALAALLGRALTDPREQAGLRLEFEATLDRSRMQTLDEVLVSVGWMKGAGPNPLMLESGLALESCPLLSAQLGPGPAVARASDDLLGGLLGAVGLARTRWAVDYDLPLALELGDDWLEGAVEASWLAPERRGLSLGRSLEVASDLGA